MASATVPTTDSPVVAAFARMSDALSTAQSMSASITAIAEAMIQQDDIQETKHGYALLEAIQACAQRIEQAVDPILDTGSLLEVDHG